MQFPTFYNSNNKNYQTNSSPYDSNFKSLLDFSHEENPPEKFHCIICNKATLLCCDCQTVFYCTHEHQQLHW